MEQELKLSHSGFALVTVLIVTAIGLLFGAGTLLLFRYQCQRRIDRQHELEKVYAVRSAANFAKGVTSIEDSGREFRCQTWSGRELCLSVKPAKRLFPDPANSSHLSVGYPIGQSRRFGCGMAVEQYDSELDYEYGAMSNNAVFAVTDAQICSRNDIGELVFPDCAATNGIKWWVNIGLKDTRGWLQEDYGIRYTFNPADYGPGSKDIIRLCIIRNTNHTEKAETGWRHGWPLSRDERALVLEVVPQTSGSVNMTLYEYAYDKLPEPRRSLFCEGSTYNMGIQIAGRDVYLFYTPNMANGFGYVLSESWEMPKEENGLFDYFSNAMRPDASGREVLGTIRAVIECEAYSTDRPYVKRDVNDRFGDVRISSFTVTPAYQYDVFLKYPGTGFELATVVQKVGKYNPDYDDDYGHCNFGFSMRTYDTHGTAWKGYKKEN